MSSLLLDAAFPNPSPGDWIDVLKAAGATGSMAYVFDPYINPDRWTPEYVQTLRDAGFEILPVYVTFDQPIGHARQVMQSYGFDTGPVLGDIELGSFPSEAIFSGWCSDLRSNGYTPVAYGTASTLDTYRRYADKGFLASYRNLHTVQPVPDLAGVSYDGWQYSDQIIINGVEVDASVTSIPLIGGDDLTPDQDARLQRVHDLLFGIAVANAPLPTPPYEANAYDLVRDVKLGTVGTGALDPHAATVLQHLVAAESAIAAVKAHTDTLATSSDPNVLAVVNGIRDKLAQHFK